MTLTATLSETEEEAEDVSGGLREGLVKVKTGAQTCLRDLNTRENREMFATATYEKKIKEFTRQLI